MTGAKGQIASTLADGGVARDWQQLRAEADMQFSPIPAPPPREPAEVPYWLEWLGEMLRRLFSHLGDALDGAASLLGLSGDVLLWIIAAAGAALLAFLLWRLASRLGLHAKPGAEHGPDWAPEAAEAQILLEEADRLAAEGQYDAATHLLLRRSVQQIRAARPGLLEPSTTAREIAALAVLPEGARRAFAVIAGRVERSLFALRNLSAEDWHVARAAYADFALPAGEPAAAP
ncbi:conserved hypothetical protein [Altererythrobacter sp. B11]|nr:conserved hypothetical protein [Altererythrobacter sp. B11]